MRNLGTMLALATALGLLGCMGDISESNLAGDVSQTEFLRAVDEDAMTSQVLYMVPDVSPVPLTAAQLEELAIDATLATPVRVEIFDEVAVAWFAPAGEAVISRNSIVAMWTVLQRTPIAGELEAGPPTVASDIEPRATTMLIETEQPNSTENRLIEGISAQTRVTNPVEQTIIDFFDLVGTPEEMLIIAILSGYHPGCI